MLKYVLTSLFFLNVIGSSNVNAVTLNGDELYFTFTEWDGPALRVWYTVPDNFDENMPIVFVMHGVGRDADRYHAEWHEYAQTYGFVLLVPEFSDADFPGAAGYNLGNVFAADGQMNHESQWSYSALDPIFTAVAHTLASKRTTYRLYGHSAGAQYAHRFLLYKPSAQLEMAIVANAGWYTMPDMEVTFPYGLKSSGLTLTQVAPVLSKPVVILLGDQDTDPAHPSLRITAEAMIQGPHRFARGHSFYRKAGVAAGETGTPFHWQLIIVAGAQHNNHQMATAAAPLLGSR